MQYLDRHPAITFWRYEPFSIEYKDVYGKTRRYIPDFLVVISDTLYEIWEVKPSFQMNRKQENFWNVFCKIEYLEQFADEQGYGVNIISDKEIEIIKNIDWKEIDKLY